MSALTQERRAYNDRSFPSNGVFGSSLCAEFSSLFRLPARVGRACSLLPCRLNGAPSLRRSLRRPLGGGGSVRGWLVVSRDACALFRVSYCRRLGGLFCRGDRARGHLLRCLRGVAVLARAPTGGEPLAPRRWMGGVRVRAGEPAHRQPLGAVRLFSSGAYTA